MRDSRTFPTLAQAQAWGKAREREIVTGKPSASRGTVGAAFIRYAKEVAPTKRGHRWEAIRLTRLGRSPLAKIPLNELQPKHVAAWRDERLREVAPASVAREFTLISSVLEQCRREWGWLVINPAKDVRKPPSPPARSRLPTGTEVERIVLALGYEGGVPQNASQRVAVAFLLAIETGMRAGELVGLTWDNVREKSVTLPRTKNGDARDVPLSVRARALVKVLPKDGPTMLGLSSAMLDALFRKAKKRAKVEGLTFHDSRAEFCTRASKKLTVLELARAIGHRDLRSLMRYYRESADALADRL